MGKTIIAKPPSVQAEVGDIVVFKMYAFKTYIGGIPLIGVYLYNKPKGEPLKGLRIKLYAGKMNQYGGVYNILKLGECVTDSNGYCEVKSKITDDFLKEYKYYIDKGLWYVSPESGAGNIFANITSTDHYGFEVLRVTKPKQTPSPKPKPKPQPEPKPKPGQQGPSTKKKPSILPLIIIGAIIAGASAAAYEVYKHRKGR